MTRVIRTMKRYIKTVTNHANHINWKIHRRIGKNSVDSMEHNALKQNESVVNSQSNEWQFATYQCILLSVMQELRWCKGGQQERKDTDGHRRIKRADKSKAREATLRNTFALSLSRGYIYRCHIIISLFQ